MNSIDLLNLESRSCFDFFWSEANCDPGSKGFGLIRDRAPGDNTVCSIASVGFGLSALVIGTERGWITRREGCERALGTLNTLLNHAQHVHGFFYHFLDMSTARRMKGCEVSIIDTAIAICGAIVAGEYFGCEVREKARQLYERVEWDWFRNSKNRFYMGYQPESGHFGEWDFYAEQLILYILGAGSPTYPVPGDMFYSFIRHNFSPDSKHGFIHSWFGSLFTHQFSHAWVDFRGKVDLLGIDWFDNSVQAARANREYCIRMGSRFQTLHARSWGLTACDGPRGYQGRYGSAPSALMNDEHYTDGTVPPAGAAGSIVFTPEESIETLSYLFENHPKLWGRYGFQDAYNLDVTPHWYASDVIGIDKGITLLMIENYRTGLIWDLFMRDSYVREGMKNVGLREYTAAVEIA